ncbi:MAG: 4-deoxy-4-formamido-L-arabinose-phosphoundecaprenol deformylase [Candidatus Binataceae bacterium]|nr:4-deoxy-4-formamido-L-arabinose-phosphoundecaprenol deformylase [Candidatus Binataceae bacterium]
MEIALKIDVDTHRGLEEGVPRMARALASAGVTASFYIAMGPDNSGRALMRVFKNRGFAGKMMRTRAVSMYGLRTILSGTLLPSRPIALALPGIVRSLADAGFEVGVHGYDHVRWQDRIDDLDEAEIRSELEEAFEAYRAIFRESPRGFAAPGWRTNAIAMKLLDRMGLLYRSDTRGTAPYRCCIEGATFDTPEIPTTLPTLDEVLNRPGLDDTASIVRFYMDRMSPESLNVHTVHAETEGMQQLDCFVALVRAASERGARFVRLADFAAGLKRDELPRGEVIRTTLEGRAGWISAQAPNAAR